MKRNLVRTSLLMTLLGFSTVQAQDSATSGSTQSATPYSVDRSISPYREANIYYLVKDGDSWKASKSADLTQDNVERVSVDTNLKLIRLKASAPTRVSAAEQERGPGSGNRWECYKRAIGESGYRDADGYSICASSLTKSVTTAGEAAIGSLNLLFGSVRTMVAVDQEKIQAVAESSGLIAMAEQDQKDKIAAEAKRKQDEADARQNAEQERLALDRKAEQGDALAKYQRALAYLGSDSWNAVAEQWLVKATAAGSADAAYKLGLFKYDHDHDHAEAERLWVKAAQGGHAGAKWSLDVLRTARADAERERAQQALQAKEEAARQAREKQRVVAFRKAIREGDETNCGLVIESKANLVKISNAVANYGNEHWIRRDQLFPSEYGCRFFNGKYQTPQIN